MSNKFLSVEEVASYFRVSRMTIYRLCESGELKFLRVGRGYRIPVTEVDRFADENTTEKSVVGAA